MGITYENQRVNFDRIVRQYKAYVALYRFINGGSVHGITGFGEFYWRMTYLSRYDDPNAVGSQGY